MSFTLPDFEESRQQMVRRQLAARGIGDDRVLAVMREVPRHRFVPPDLIDSAYHDNPLPIGLGQTISQPYIVAFMTEMLRLTPQSKVLEIGTGSGYQTAILSRLAGHVFTVEVVAALAEHSRSLLNELGYSDNVDFHVGDGSAGWPEYAPFDGIIVTAAAPSIPVPLSEQLAEGGSLVIPVGPAGYQSLVRQTRRGTDLPIEHLTAVAFVPLLGQHGWRESEFRG